MRTEKPNNKQHWAGYTILLVLLLVIALLTLDLHAATKADQGVLSWTSLLLVLGAVVITLLFWYHSNREAEELQEELEEISEEAEEAQSELNYCDHELGLVRKLSAELSSAISVREAVEITNRYINFLCDVSMIGFMIYDPRLHAFQQLVYLSGSLSEDTVTSLLNDARESLTDNGPDEIVEAARKAVIEPRIISGSLANADAAELNTRIVLPIGQEHQLSGAIVLGCTKAEAMTSEGLLDSLKTKLSILAMAIQRVQSFLIEQRSRTQSVVENSSNGVIIFEEDGKTITLANPAAADMTGLRKGQFTIDDLCAVLADTVDLRSKIDVVLKEGRRIKLEDMQHKDRNFDIFLTPIFDYHEDVVGGAIILNDITHFMEIDRMKTEFVSIASHQLRTPLTSINWFIEMLLSGDVGKLDDQQREYLNEILQGSQRMVGLVNDLLNVSRLETGRLKIDTEATDITELIVDIVKEAEPLGELKDVGLIFHKPVKKLERIEIDASLIREVIHNLITNAIRYTPADDHRSVEIKLYTEYKDSTEQVMISVADSGIGIPEDQQKYIFDKFFRADNAIQMAASGSGLGLYIAKMVMDASGGGIWFDSSPEKGTTFYLQIPITGMKAHGGDKGLT